MAAAQAGRAAALLLALVLAWRILEVNLAWYGDHGRPKVPELGREQELSRAERKAGERDILRGMLAANPADLPAALSLAADLEREGQAERASAAYRAILAIAPMDRRVLAWSMAHFLRQADPLGVGILARLASNYPDTHAAVFPILVRVMMTAAHADAWREVVARDPPWMGRFLLDACRRGVQPALLLPTILERSEKGRAVREESDCVIEALQAADRWEDAYHFWLSLLPRDRLASVGHVFNGSFESAPLGGFDWILQPASEREAGHAADIVVARDATGRTALRVIYVGKRQAGVPARQYLALLPGKYDLAGRVRQEGITALRGIQWTLRCVQGGKRGSLVAASERFVGSSEWRSFSTSFDVGPECRGQVLQLEPVAEEGAVAFVSGTVWFDDLQVTLR